MSRTIIYTSVEQQVERLKSQNLIINDEQFACDMLKLYGYSNLIKSYRDPYIVMDRHGKKSYRANVTFEQICSLYLFDKNLRNAVMATMLDFEEHIKEIVANVVADSFGIHQDEYLNFSNYSDRRVRDERFSLSYVLNSMKEALRFGRSPVSHYKQIYNLVPPWILFKNVYFGTIVNFYDKFKRPEKLKAASLLYNMEDVTISDDSLVKLMRDTLFICYEYRNLVAHGGRTYNHQCSSSLRGEEIFGSDYINQGKGINQLLLLLELVHYTHPFSYLNGILSNEVSRHCNDFPQDMTYLGQVLNINIELKNFVYSLPTSARYHTNPNCSGMVDSIQIELHDAEKEGLSACKKCAQNIIPIV